MVILNSATGSEILIIHGQTSDEIWSEILSQVNAFLETCDIGQSFRTNPRYAADIFINWYYASGTIDFFEARFDKNDIIYHFTLNGGGDVYNFTAKIIYKNKFYVFILPWVN
jgi:hypothetical protein